jgi:predicted transcriptional regulator
MNEPQMIDFRIVPEKVARLDLMAKAMDCDRSHLLNQALDAYLRLAIPNDQSAEAILDRELMNEEEAGMMAGSLMPMQSVVAELADPMLADPDPAIHTARAGSYMFLALPVTPRKMEEAKAPVQFPILVPGETKGRLLIFLSAKGGSGVTTVACNFAVSLAR